ncbi:MAG TPA: hypothetical protein VN767_03975 [Streptosporangiaceae bacterium]|nr:hypothetical protein [Streptosporangiaceae bacterium]
MTLDSTRLPAPLSGGAPDNPAGNRPADGTGPRREPPRWWTLPIPLLLTLPVAAWCVLITAIANLCFDYCDPPGGLVTPVGVTELFLAVAAIVLLIVGLAVRIWRRALRLALWIACTLSCLGAIYQLTWSSSHP